MMFMNSLSVLLCQCVPNGFKQTDASFGKATRGKRASERVTTTRVQANMSGKRKSASQIDKGNFEIDTLIDTADDNMLVGDDESDEGDDDFEEEEEEEEEEVEEEDVDGDDDGAANDVLMSVVVGDADTVDGRLGLDSDMQALSSSVSIAGEFKKSKGDIKKPLSSWTIFITERSITLPYTRLSRR